MDFTSLEFIAFLALVVILYWACPARFRAFLLLVCSYAFYCSWSAALAILLFGATSAVYLAARAIETFRNDSTKRAVLFGVVSLLILILTFYKSAPFWQGVLGVDLLAPLGLSYYTIKLIGYLIDVFWSTIPAERAFIPFAAYVAFFPQIVAGPIQRSTSFLPQMQRAGKPSLHAVAFGLQRILLGYFKKFLIADKLVLLVDFIFSHLYKPGTPILVGCYAYPLQMYADFSGLTDIANGIACMLGFHTPENFNAPFTATSIGDYWRRWHMSFTQWLTDYVFTPLRMSTRAFGSLGLILSLMVMMVLIGLWHAFRLSFVLFGLIHAFYLSVEALTTKSRRKFYKAHPAIDRAMNWLGPILVFNLVTFGLIFFRGRSLQDIFYILGHITQGLSVPSAEFSAFWEMSKRPIVVSLAALVIAEAFDYLRRGSGNGGLLITLPRWGRWAAYSCTATAVFLTICMLLLGGAVHNPFVYAVF